MSFIHLSCHPSMHTYIYIFTNTHSCIRTVLNNWLLEKLHSSKVSIWSLFPFQVDGWGGKSELLTQYIHHINQAVSTRAPTCMFAICGSVDEVCDAWDVAAMRSIKACSSIRLQLTSPSDAAGHSAEGDRAMRGRCLEILWSPLRTIVRSWQCFHFCKKITFFSPHHVTLCRFSKNTQDSQCCLFVRVMIIF